MLSLSFLLLSFGKHGRSLAKSMLSPVAEEEAEGDGRTVPGLRLEWYEMQQRYY